MSRPTFRSSRRRLAVVVRAALLGLPALLPVAFAGLAAAPSHAESAGQRDYAIPAGPLSAALSRFAAEAGVLLSANASVTDGLRSPGLQGRYDVAGGFAALLAGTGLQAVPGMDLDADRV